MTTLLVLCMVGLGLVALRRWRFSFPAQRAADYAGDGPAMDITRHLAGPLHSEGVIFGPDGRVASRFVAHMHGRFDGKFGTLDEHFSYAGGGKQDRQWRLTPADGGHFTAEADDVIGVGRGVHAGSSVRMTYRLRLSEDAGGHVLDVIDWMYLLENGTVMNKSEMRKFGVKVAELVATIRPAAD